VPSTPTRCGLRGAVRASLVAAARGEAVLPGVLHLDLGARRGDLHVKGAWLTSAPTFAIKVAGAFPGAVAVEQLVPARVRTLALVGAGSQARHQLRAILRVRTPERVVVWARRAEAAARFVLEAGEEHGLDVRVTASVGEAVRGADVVVTTTPARAPLVHAADLPDDVLLVGLSPAARP